MMSDSFSALNKYDFELISYSILLPLSISKRSYTAKIRTRKLHRSKIMFSYSFDLVYENEMSWTCRVTRHSYIVTSFHQEFSTKTIKLMFELFR